MKVTHKTLEQVWQTLMEDHPDKGDRIEIAKAFNAMLDELFWDDFFGSEGQTDPRGDHRD